MTQLAEIRSKFTPWLLLSLAMFGVFVWIDMQVMDSLALKAADVGDGWAFLRWLFVLVHLRAPSTPPVIAWIALASWGVMVTREWALDWPLLAPLIIWLEAPDVHLALEKKRLACTLFVRGIQGLLEVPPPPAAVDCRQPVLAGVLQLDLFDPSRLFADGRPAADETRALPATPSCKRFSIDSIARVISAWQRQACARSRVPAERRECT